MSQDDAEAPVSEDAFPEFAEPPRHRPAAGAEPAAASGSGRGGSSEVDDRQAGVDEVLARLRKKRGEGDS